MDNLSYIISVMPNELKEIFQSLERQALSAITEIRIRKGKPVILYLHNKPYFISRYGKLINHYAPSSVIMDEREFDNLTDRLCNNSYHTKMSSMINGYITTKYGSRIGISSTAVNTDNQITSIKDITSLNIRIAKEVINCSRQILNMLYVGTTPSIIVAGPPSSGKTSVLRDCARLLSSGFSGEYRKISIIDERSEIASGFDVGINTDVLNGFGKAKGIEIAVRTLSPDIIICDEIGNAEELDSIKFGFSSGISFIVSVHAKTQHDLIRRSIIRELIEAEEFDYIILLKDYTNEFDIIDISEAGIENSGNDNDNPFFLLPWNDGC